MGFGILRFGARSPRVLGVGIGRLCCLVATLKAERAHTAWAVVAPMTQIAFVWYRQVRAWTCPGEAWRSVAPRCVFLYQMSFKETDFYLLLSGFVCRYARDLGFLPRRPTLRDFEPAFSNNLQLSFISLCIFFPPSLPEVNVTQP